MYFQMVQDIPLFFDLETIIFIWIRAMEDIQ